jgi:hypothetical protein
MVKQTFSSLLNILTDPKNTPLHQIVNSNCKEALANDSIKALLQWKWETYGREIFMKQAILYMIFCIAYSANVILFSYEDYSDTLHDVYLTSGTMKS